MDNKLLFNKFVKDNVDIVTKVCSDSHNNIIDFAVYFIPKFNTLPSRISFSNIVKIKLINYLQENNWLSIQEVVTSKSKTKNEEAFALIEQHHTSSSNDRSIWIKDRYIVYVIDEAEGLCEVLAAYDCNDTSACDFLKSAITAFEKEEENSSSFYLLTKNGYGELDLKKYNAKMPDGINLSLNYGKDFDKVNETILDKLANNQSGLYILHGASGTGKSTYIKWLATNVKKKFIYVPEFMVPSINDPNVMQLFLEHTNSVVILEDAEKLLTKREASATSMASLILNLSDGILSDIMKLSVIVTYNTSTDNIDQALLRKGRLRYIYEFKPLNIEDAKTLMVSHGINKKQMSELEGKGLIKKQMSLAEIYNMYDENGIEPTNNNPSSFGFTS